VAPAFDEVAELPAAAREELARCRRKLVRLEALCKQRRVRAGAKFTLDSFAAQVEAVLRGDAAAAGRSRPGRPAEAKGSSPEVDPRLTSFLASINDRMGSIESRMAGKERAWEPPGAREPPAPLPRAPRVEQEYDTAVEGRDTAVRPGNL
jgi:hypothetical protein